MMTAGNRCGTLHIEVPFLFWSTPTSVPSARLIEIIEAGQVKTITIAHGDQLVRLSFEWLEAFCERHSTRRMQQAWSLLKSAECRNKYV